MSRLAYAHDAVVQLDADADRRAPGAAITVALCGHWEHEPPCPLAPHYAGVADEDGLLRVRILFATEPENEAEVRRRIDAALSGGELAGPDERTTGWRLRESGPSGVRASEAEHAGRLAAQ